MTDLLRGLNCQYLELVVPAGHWDQSCRRCLPMVHHSTSESRPYTANCSQGSTHMQPWMYSCCLPSSCHHSAWQSTCTLLQVLPSGICQGSYCPWGVSQRPGLVTQHHDNTLGRSTLHQHAKEQVGVSVLQLQCTLTKMCHMHWHHSQPEARMFKKCKRRGGL